MSQEARRVMIVDDDPLVHDGMGRVLNGLDDLCLCAEADGTGDVAAQVSLHHPDIVLMGISLRSKRGIAVLTELRRGFPSLPVVVFAEEMDCALADLAMSVGARGFVAKRDALSDVLQALRDVLDGKVWITPEVRGHMIKASLGSATPGASPVARLTFRQRAILNCIGRGMVVSEMARHMGIAENTVEAHRDRLRQRLGLGSTRELTSYAMQWVSAESAWRNAAGPVGDTEGARKSPTLPGSKRADRC